MRPLRLLSLILLSAAVSSCAATDDVDVSAAPIDAPEPEPQPAPEPAAPTFGQADLEELVNEILTVAPQNENYVYPVTIRMRETDDDGKDVVNAWARTEQRDDGHAHPVVEMFRGLVDLAKGDKRVLRAVLAHEIAHVSLGHPLEAYGLGDLQNHFTRQQERAADEAGSQYLEALGYSREDMVDMLQMLDRFSKDMNVPWLGMVTGDHASCITRAAHITGDEALLTAVSKFEIGLAYMECRRYEAALAFFDEALSLQPDLREARLDAATAALQDYYDRLPASVQDAWLRPEFGPHLTDVIQLAGRAIDVTDEDLRRYQEALDRIDACTSLWYQSMQGFLRGTAHVLHPGGDTAAIRQGVSELQALLDENAGAEGWGFDRIRLAVANNLALGLARLDEGARAVRLVIEEQAANMKYLPSLAENLTRLPLGELSDQQIGTAYSVLMHYVRWTPPDAPGAREAERVVKRLSSQHGFRADDVADHVPLALCGVASMTIDGREVGLFQTWRDVSAILGRNADAGVVNAKYPALEFIFWGDKEVIALLESDALVKLTSYRPGSFLVLRPQRDSGLKDTFEVRVGMTEAEFDALLTPAGGSTQLGQQLRYLLDSSSFTAPGAEAQQQESWRYYPTLNFGVLVRDGTIAAISVTPSK